MAIIIADVLRKGRSGKHAESLQVQPARDQQQPAPPADVNDDLPWKSPQVRSREDSDEAPPAQRDHPLDALEARFNSTTPPARNDGAASRNVNAQLAAWAAKDRQTN
jgi:hypothetical protein